MKKYLEGEPIEEAEVAEALVQGVRDGKIFPVFCGSAKADIGVKKLLGGIAAYLPAPAATVLGTEPETGELVERGISEAFSALACKTVVDPQSGRQTYLRIETGTLRGDTTVLDVTTGRAERIGSLSTLRGRQAHTVTLAHAGDIVVTAKLAAVRTGDTLAAKDAPILYEMPAFPAPMLEMAVVTEKKEEADKVLAALAKEQEQQQTLAVRREEALQQTVVAALGEMQLTVLAEQLARKYHVELKLSRPRVAYRETIRKAAQAEGKFKKQSGGHGQFGHVVLEIQPQEAGAGNAFSESIFGGSVPRQYPGRREGRGGDARGRHPRGLSRRRCCRPSHGWLLSPRRFLRGGVQGGDGHRTAPGRPRGRSRTPRAARRDRGHDARVLPRRRHRQAQRQARPHPRHGDERQGYDCPACRRARGGALRLHDRASLSDAGARYLHALVPAL